MLDGSGGGGEFKNESKLVCSLMSVQSRAGATIETLYVQKDAPVSHTFARNGSRYVFVTRTVMVSSIVDVAGLACPSVMSGTVGIVQACGREKAGEMVSEPGAITTMRAIVDAMMERR